MNIVIAAVGGQGALLASRILGSLAQELNYDVKVSEVHGMSQRGGSVVAYVRFGDKIYSPVIEKGSADMILAFEQLEGARYVDYLKENGALIMNTQRIDPMPVITGQMRYPDKLQEELRKVNIRFIPVDALSLARESGNVKAVNVALIGAMAGMLNIDKKLWISAIRANVPLRLLDVNIRAFESGVAYSTNVVLNTP